MIHLDLNLSIIFSESLKIGTLAAMTLPIFFPSLPVKFESDVTTKLHSINVYRYMRYTPNFKYKYVNSIKSVFER